MQLSDFIKKLQAIEAEGHGDLPVVLSDWAEGYDHDSETVAEVMSVVSREYYPSGAGMPDTLRGLVVCIGD